MSVRIYEISRELDMENKEVMDILRSRGYEVKSASSTIDNISAEAFIDEHRKKATEAMPAPVAPTPEPVSAPKPNIPAGAIVKTRADLDRERQEKEAAEQRAREEELAKRREAMQPGKPAPEPAPGPKSPVMPKMPTAKSPAMPTMPRPPSMAQPAPAMPKMSMPAPTKPKEERGPQVTLPPKGATPPPIPSREETKKVVIGASVPAKPASVEEGKVVEQDGQKIIQVKPPIVVRDFAGLIDMKPFKLISELMDIGIFAGMNQTIEEDVAARLAERHGFKLEVRHRGEEQPQAKAKPKVELSDDDPSLLEPRPPVVCVLGHVDHGKTTLLDSIRKANVVAGEAGGITQHIGAYQVEQGGHKITFIDTPGHAAFSKMRERGANVTDVAILVVAADDGFMPQTDEALKFAQKANVPVVIAINKMDAKGANIDRVKQQLQQRGIASEDWGGETLCASVSALNGDGIEELLELVLLQAEVLELKANPKCEPVGVVVESQVEQGRGSTATVIVQRGTLKAGTALVCGANYCKVRAMLDENGKQVKAAPPSSPVRIMGWSGAPQAGSEFKAVKNDKVARREAEENALQLKESARSQPSDSGAAPMDLESLLNAIDGKQQKCLRVIVKADVHGSMEAVIGMLEAIHSDKVTLEVIESSVGLVSKNDIVLAGSSEATVVAFNTRLENGVQAQAKHDDVRLIQHNIIYELVDQVKEAMAELLEPEYRENKLGAAEVRAVFPVAKGYVAGCMVTEGLVKRDAFARLLRGDDVVHEGRIGTLKRFKDDATEVRAGYECGAQITGCHHYEEKDIIEVFEIVEFRPSL